MQSLKGEQNKMPKWEVVMRTFNPHALSYGADPKKGRPRRWSLHALASVCGYEDPLLLLKEMGDSGKVLGYPCPDVGGAAIFYMEDMKNLPGMINTPRAGIFNPEGPIKGILERYPFPQVRGFRRFSRAGESAGMPTPFDPQDAGDVEYEKIVLSALAANS